MLTIEARATGRRRSLLPSWGIPLPPEWGEGEGLTLRDVIARVVREDVAAFRERQGEARFLRVLTEAELADSEQTGRIASRGQSESQPGPNASASAKAKAYGKLCQNQSKKHVAGTPGTPFSDCVSAAAKLLKSQH